MHRKGVYGERKAGVTGEKAWMRARTARLEGEKGNEAGGKEREEMGGWEAT